MNRWINVVLATATPLWLQAQAATPSVLREYDFRPAAAERHTLPTQLQEVSGLATAADGRVYAHNDERAIISELDPHTGAVRNSFSLGAPAEPGDFEGLAIVRDRFFLVTSTGLLYAARAPAGNSSASFERYDTGAGRLCEIEGLAYDATSDRLLLPCKTAVRRTLRGQLLVLAVPLRSLRVEPRPVIALSYAQLPQPLRGSGARLTAIEVVPGTHSWLLLSSVPAALIEVSATGALLGVQLLQQKQHPQAEGLTITADRTLVITNEGGTGAGTVTLYPRVTRTP